MSELVALGDAITAVLARAAPLGTERVSLDDAPGRVLAETARARIDLPLFPSSAMDGYAVRAADTPGRLPVVSRIAAGHPAESALAAGTAMAIATGGVVPDGADAVVPVEQTAEEGAYVRVVARLEPGQHVRPRGGDVTAGGAVVPAGARLGAAQIGALAAAGLPEVVCHRQPRVAILATGSELRHPGVELGPGEIFESNGAMLAAHLSARGAVVERLPPVADDEESHRAAIQVGLDSDVLVTSGGVSVGPHDLVRRIARELGVEEMFWGVAMKPGKPVSFGLRGRTLAFGLPGNPVSSLVASALFVCPALAALQGDRSPGPHFEPGLLAEDVRRDGRRDLLVRATVSVSGEHALLSPVGGQDSHMIVRAALADVLVLVPRGEGTMAAGSPARFVRL